MLDTVSDASNHSEIDNDDDAMIALVDGNADEEQWDVSDDGGQPASQPASIASIPLTDQCIAAVQ